MQKCVWLRLVLPNSISYTNILKGLEMLESIKKVYTLIGYYSNNTFVDHNNNKYEDILTYRQYNRIFTPDTLICCNVRWSTNLNCWIIFQAIEINIEDVFPTVVKQPELTEAQESLNS